MNYKTYAEAKIANPDCEIVTTGKGWVYDKELIGTFEPRVTEGCSHAINDYSWVICNPADYCSTLKEFLDAGFKLVAGDVVMTVNCSISIVKEDAVDSWNHHGVNDNGFFILSASVLNCGCKIPAKVEQWTIYNNTLPLSELTDEQVGKLVKNSGCVESLNKNSGEWGATISPMWNRAGVYRIKPKSERELFIDKSMEVCKENQHNKVELMLGRVYDAGARYTDLTQYFGENI